MNKLVIFTIIAVLFAAGSGAYFIFLKPNSDVSQIGKCGDGVCGPAEAQNNLCPQDCASAQTKNTVATGSGVTGVGSGTTGSTKPTTTTPPAQNQPTGGQSGQPAVAPSNIGDNSFDADGVLWGTYSLMKIFDSTDVVNKTLKTKNLKVGVPMNLSSDGKTFSTTVCMPSAENCLKKYDTDELVATFKKNGWSMRPMFSFREGLYAAGMPAATDQDIKNYVGYVDWFVSRYKDDANIKYIELQNTPAQPLITKFLTLNQLLTMQNNVYDTIKGKFPDIMVGTHGFEYHFDDGGAMAKTMLDMVNFFLDKNNGVKFDYWAFHGYPKYSSPIKTSTYNKYAGGSGVLEVRKKLDANGWQSRLIIDTEHSSLSANRALSDAEDKADAAYIAEEMTIKKAMRYGGRSVLSGISPFIMLPRSTSGMAGWGALLADGSLSKTVKAGALLMSKFNEYNYAEHISGEFNSYDKVWIEKFRSGDGKELYIFFKPIGANDKPAMTLDTTKLGYTLTLDREPSAVTLTDILGQQTNVTPSRSLILSAVNSPKYLEIGYK